MTGIAINGTLGFGMLLTILFRLGDLDSALAESPAFPFMAIFHHAVQSRSGAAVMVSIIIVLTISANVGFSASTSRICWAFARDRGLPGWRTLSKVRTKLRMSVDNANSCLGQRQDFDSSICCGFHKHHCLYPRPYQHWFDHCFQRCHLGRHRRLVLLVHPDFLPTSLPTLYRRHSSGWSGIRDVHTIHHTRRHAACLLGTMEDSGCIRYC